MTPDLIPAADLHRERVVVFLAILSSEECRAALAPPKSPEAFAFDLCRLWFETIYTPSRRLVEGLRGEYSDAAARLFEEAFSEEERKTMERFHHFLGLRIDMLSDEARRRGCFPDNERWASIVRDAAYLLDDLEPDSARIQALLATLLRRASGPRRLRTDEPGERSRLPAGPAGPQDA